MQTRAIVNAINLRSRLVRPSRGREGRAEEHRPGAGVSRMRYQWFTTDDDEDVTSRPWTHGPKPASAESIYIIGFGFRRIVDGSLIHDRAVPD